MQILLACCLFVIQRSPLGAVRALGRFLGGLAWRLDRRRRRITLRNLGIAFGKRCPGSPSKLAQECFRRLGEQTLVTAWVAGRSDEEISPLFVIKGVEEHLRPALKTGHGVVHAMFHLGNWEILARIVTCIPGVNFSVIYQPLRNQAVDREIGRWRARSGVRLIDRRRGFAGAAARLRRGDAVGMFVDQHAGDHGIWVPFFDRLASTTTLPAVLARRTGANIVPIFCRDAPAQSASPGQPLWTIEFGPAIRIRGRTDGRIMAEIHEHLEHAIRQDPAGWFWLHDRWKTPSPNILLQRYRRGLYVPAGMQLKPFRLLVHGVNWIGDSILTIPALRAIKAGRPDCQVNLLVPPHLADLWRGQPFVDRIFISPDEVAGEEFDAAIILPNSFRSALRVWQLRIPRRFGYAGDHRSRLLTAVCPESFRAGTEEHDARDFCGLVRWLGGSVGDEIPRLDLDPPQEPGKALPRAKPLVILHPGAAYGTAKRWLPERFAELVRRFPEVRWCLIGSSDERLQNSELARSMDHGIEDRTGSGDLKELGRLLSGARALVCNDSGPMHLAAAVGTPVVAIFGSTEPRHTGPLGEGHRVIRRVVECSPCYLRTCPIDLRCMKAVSVDEVEKALKDVLAAREQTKRGGLASQASRWPPM